MFLCVLALDLMSQSAKASEVEIQGTHWASPRGAQVILGEIEL